MTSDASGLQTSGHFDVQSTSHELSAPVVLLCAIDRAITHQAKARVSIGPGPSDHDTRAVTIHAIASHLGYTPRSRLKRPLRTRLDVMAQGGWLEVVGGRPAWALTRKGRVTAAQNRERALATLPESPQHRMWREGQQVAEQQIEQLYALAHKAGDDAAALLAEESRDYQAWIEIAQRLRDAFWRVGAASYCLFEWTEPDDIRADIDLRSEANALKNSRNWSLSQPGVTQTR